MGGFTLMTTAQQLRLSSVTIHNYYRPAAQVGGFTLMATADMRRVAPLWLKLSEDVREDPLVSKLPQFTR